MEGEGNGLFIYIHNINTSRGDIFSPPRLMSSLRRPVRVR